MRYKLQYGNASAGDWRKTRKTFEELVNEAESNASIVSPYEASVFRETIQEFKNLHAPRVVEGAIEEYHAALDDYKVKERQVEKARAAEIVRWDHGKLSAQMQVITMQVDAALSSGDDITGALKGLMGEARRSEDPHIQRATFEVLRGAIGKTGYNQDLQLKMELNRIAKEAGRELETLRTTPQLEAAHQEAEASFNHAMYAKKELLDTRTIMQIADSVTPYGEMNRDSLERKIHRALGRVQEVNGRVSIAAKGE
jgi:hypothetical protein